MPLVSVIMPVYNAEKYLSLSIKSILNQTFKEFEFIIIDDASTDNSLKVVKSFSDERIVLLINEKNSGVVLSLNKGIEIAKGKFICRMDADDISNENRLHKQVEFLNANPKISLLGSQAMLIDENGNILGEQSVPQLASEINRTKFIHNPFIHATVIFRHELVTKYGTYDYRRKHNEDYDLWLRYTRSEQACNLPDRLLLRRIHSESITVSKELELVWNRFLTIANAIIFHYRNPFLFVYLIRPMLAFLYKKYFKK